MTKKYSNEYCFLSIFLFFRHPNWGFWPQNKDNWLILRGLAKVLTYRGKPRP